MTLDPELVGKRPPYAASDPRFLIVLFILIVVFSFIVRSTEGLLLILSYLLVIHRLARLSLRRLARRTRDMMVLLALVVAVNAVLVKGSPLPPPLSFLSREGLAAGIFYGLRALTVYYALIVFLSLASQEAIAKGIAALLRPFSEPLARRAALYGFLTIGFLPVFADEIERIRVAQRFRGGGLHGGFARRTAAVRLLFVPLVVSAIHRSGHLATAVEVRGIRSSITRLLNTPRPGHRDLVFAAVTLVLLVGASSIG